MAILTLTMVFEFSNDDASFQWFLHEGKRLSVNVEWHPEGRVREHHVCLGHPDDLDGEDERHKSPHRACG